MPWEAAAARIVADYGLLRQLTLHEFEKLLP